MEEADERVAIEEEADRHWSEVLLRAKQRLTGTQTTEWTGLLSRKGVELLKEQPLSMRLLELNSTLALQGEDTSPQSAR